MIIFCGHFPDGALHFTEEEIEDETRSEWYLRQVLGAANFEGGPLLHILSGNLGFQIEHHLFPDLPSNRYAEIAGKVQALCEKYDLPYTTGPLHRQYGQALRTIIKLSLPNRFTSCDQPEPPPRGWRAQAPYRRGAAGPAYRAGRLVAQPRRGARMIATMDPGTLFAWGDSLDDLVGKRGHPVRAEPHLRRLRGAAGAADRVPRHAARGGPQRLPLPAHARRVRACAAGEVADTELVTTAGFEFVRPSREDDDRRPTFQPNSLLSQ